MNFILFLLISYSDLYATCSREAQAQVLTEIDDKKLKEISGLDMSKNFKDIFWAINDSGNDPILYAVGLDGKIKNEFKVKDAKNIDWEDISVASCFYERSKDCIYISDTGNNLRSRDSFQIYVVEEPDIHQSKELFLVKTIDFKLEGKFNIEALSINEHEMEIYLLSKSDDLEPEKNTSQIFSLNPASAQVAPIIRINFNDYFIKLRDEDMIVTSSDFDNETQTLLIGTYGNAFEIKMNELTQFKTHAQMIKVPTMKQPESISYYDTDQGLNILTTSEGKKKPLYLLQCK